MQKLYFYFQEIYDVDTAAIPTFVQSKFTELPPTLCASDQDWCEAIAKSCIQKSTDRPVLVICECVGEVDKLEAHFNTLTKEDWHKNDQRKPFVYKRCILHYNF